MILENFQCLFCTLQLEELDIVKQSFHRSVFLRCRRWKQATKVKSISNDSSCDLFVRRDEKLGEVSLCDFNHLLLPQPAFLFPQAFQTAKYSDIGRLQQIRGVRVQQNQHNVQPFSCFAGFERCVTGMVVDIEDYWKLNAFVSCFLQTPPDTCKSFLYPSSHSLTSPSLHHREENFLRYSLECFRMDK